MTEITYEELLYVVENLGGVPGIIRVDFEVNKPAPNPSTDAIGRLCIVDESGRIYKDTGSDWSLLGFSGGTLTSPLVLSGDATAALNPVSLQQWQAKAWKSPLTAATTGALPTNTRTGNILTMSANGALPAQDGVTLSAGQSLLVQNEATGANNGFYDVTNAGAVGAAAILTRRADADTSSKLASGIIVQIAQGTIYGGKIRRMTNTTAPTLNTTALAFAAVPTDWADLTSKPSTFAPSAHASSHQSGGSDAIALDAAAITSGTVAAARLPASVSVGAFDAFKVGSQVDIPLNTATKVTFENYGFNQSSWFDLTNDRYLPLIAGYYILGSGVGLGSSVDQKIVKIDIYKNGAFYRQITNLHTSGTAAITGNSAVPRIFANGTTDYFEIYVTQSSAATGINITSAWFAGGFVGT